MKQQTLDIFPTPGIEILQGHALDVLKGMDPESVHCCVTSPPYWGLRDYGTEPLVWDGGEGCEHVWGDVERGGLLHENRNFKSGPNAEVEGPLVKVGDERRNQGGQFCQLCGAWKGSLGLEPTPELFISHLVQIFREVRRVLRDDGTIWVNMGDSYSGSGKGAMADGSGTGGPKQRTNKGTQVGKFLKSVTEFKPKDLIGIPWMLAFALRADGWYLRSDIIWHKPNPMPESVKDRPTKAHEYIFLLSKSQKYFYDGDAIKEPNKDASIKRYNYSLDGCYTPGSAYPNEKREHPQQWKLDPNGRNKRSVWTVTTQPCKEAHFATFPTKLIEPCIMAGCPEGGTVLDPFFGAGTTGIVSRNLGRNCIGIELNLEYIKIAKDRIG
jgi:DNA modification methylase